VAFPKPLPLRVAPRIAAAGALHNAAMFLFFLLPLGIWIWPILGFANISESGVAITTVDADSDLFSHLPSSSLISSLNNYPLTGGISSWEAFFASSSQFEPLGWCAETAWLSLQPTLTDATLSPASVCFSTDALSLGTRCFDPTPILTSSVLRCPCSSGKSCIFPPKNMPILRIALDDGRVVLWRGPELEVYEQGIFISILSSGYFQGASSTRFKLPPSPIHAVPAKFPRYCILLRLVRLLACLFRCASSDGPLATSVTSPCRFVSSTFCLFRFSMVPNS
jgi:hypothetical protein